MPRISSRIPIAPISRRRCLSLALSATASISLNLPSLAAQPPAFARWVAGFRARALGRGVSAATYDRVMDAVTPDSSVLAEYRAQPEFTEQVWQYINRRCSDWRVITGKERAKEYADLLARIEKDYGVDRTIMLGLWGMESSFGDVIVNPKYMRPVIPALAALAWGEPRRRAYWEAELINALTIVDRGWAQPAQMIGSWAGAMGHTQWMPEVWLHMGVDYDGNGRITPFGRPDDSLAGTAHFLVERGHYRRGEAWGCEVRLGGRKPGGWRSYEQWHALGINRADGKAFARPGDRAKLWVPVPGGPAFLVGQNFYAVHSYNPSTSYTLALCHLGDLIRGDPPFVQQFPGGERVPTIDEVKEIQRRLNERGFKTDGIDGRTGSDTIKAILAFERKVGMEPADGYAGLKVLARLRQGS
ncbi:MAG TPA: lytic murein transglycosylase [Pseudolabrys sp.]|nr:lytic murein transglycosylase [Pseudolabrys sp.]HUI15644.1 lytic murein transglycosylase [Xanthobacteraceae bacterium]